MCSKCIIFQIYLHIVITYDLNRLIHSPWVVLLFVLFHAIDRGEVSEELAAAYHLPLDPHLNWFTLETPRRRPLLCFSRTEKDEVGMVGRRQIRVARFEGCQKDLEVPGSKPTFPLELYESIYIASPKYYFTM